MLPEPARLRIPENAERFEFLPLQPGDVDEPLVEQTLIGTVLPVEWAEQLPAERKELKAYVRPDGAISFRKELARDEFRVFRLQTNEINSTDRRLVPHQKATDVVTEIVSEHGTTAVGPPPQARLSRWKGFGDRPYVVAEQFATDPLAIAVATQRVTRVRLGTTMGVTEAIVMLAAIFPDEQLLVFCTNKYQIRDAISELRAGGLTATDRPDLKARVLLTRSTDGFMKPSRVQHRRIVALLNESNLTKTSAEELSHLPDTSRLIAFSSMQTVDSEDDRKRIETWFGSEVHRRHVATAPPRPIRGTFAGFKTPSRRGQTKFPTAWGALRRHVIENGPFHDAMGRMLNQDVSKWTSRLSRCDDSIVKEMASPLVIVCSTLKHATKLLKQTKRAVLATSQVKTARKHAGQASDRVVAVRSDLSSADRVIVTLSDFQHLKTIGSILRVDCSPGPLPITERQHERWGFTGVTSPIHVIDLNRVDFEHGRMHAASRAACYAADLMSFAHAPPFKPQRMPPVRYTIGCGYGTKHVVYHRRPPAERRPR